MTKYLYYLCRDREGQRLAMSKFKIVYENKAKCVLAGGNADDVKIVDKQWHSVFSLATVEGKEALYKLAYEGGNSIYLYENPNDFLEGSEIKKLTSTVAINYLNRKLQALEEDIQRYQAFAQKNQAKWDELNEKKRLLISEANNADL